MYCQECLVTIFEKLNTDCLRLVEYLNKKNAKNTLNALEIDDVVGELKEGALKNKHRVEKSIESLSILGLVSVEYRSVPKKIYLSEDGLSIYKMLNGSRMSA